MYPYPPPVIDWKSLICTLIVPAAVLIMLSVMAWHQRPMRRAAKWVAGFVLLWMLVANLLPATANVREAARRTQCKNNLKHIAAGIHKFQDEHDRLPPPQKAEDGGPPVSWRIDLMPYIRPGSSSPGADYDHSHAWDDSANQDVAQRRPEEYICPSNGAPQDEQQRWYSAYALLTGPGTPFPADGPLKLYDITDGMSYTLLVVEACGRNIVWTEPRDVDVSRETIEINAPGEKSGTSNGILSSYHEERVGGHCALADGSVRFLSTKISPDVLRKLTTAAGGEGITDDDFW